MSHWILLNAIQSLILIGLFFFVVGLHSVAQSLSPLGVLAGRRESRHEGLHVLIGVLAFCFLSNALMAIPAVLELLVNIDSQTAYFLNRVAIGLLKLVVFLVATIGLFSCFGRPGLSRSWPGAGVVPLRSRLLFSPGGLLVWVTASVLSIYLVTAQYLAPVNYDTALYHLPAVAHFLKYGLEVGLANLQFSLGFYNLPLFGQAVFQGFSPSRLILSPSINLVFCISLIVSVASGVIDCLTRPLRYSSLVLPRQLIFAASVLVFAQFDLSSLVSFNADFALTCATLTLIYLAVFNESVSVKKLILFLSFLLPAIKLSGLLGCALIVLYLSLRHCLSQEWEFPVGLFFWRNGSVPLLGWRFALALVLCYLLVFLTYFLLSGYLVFPQVETGPWLGHAVPLDQASYVKGALVTYYARLNDTSSLAQIANAQHWGVSQWLPRLLQTDRGMLMSLWLGLAACMPVLALLVKRLCARNYSYHSIALALAMLAVVGMAFFLMPPNPRFFPWVGAVLAYGYGELIIVSPPLVLAILFVLINGLSFRLQRPLLKSMTEEVPYRVIKVPVARIHGWRPREVQRSVDGDFVMIRKPQADQCWATDRPCTPYFWFVKKTPSIR